MNALAQDLACLVVWRGLPVLLWALPARRVARPAKAIVSAIVAAPLLFGPFQQACLEVVTVTGVTLGYFAAIACLVFAARRREIGARSGLGWFLFLWVVCILVPAPYVQQGGGVAVVAVLGWEVLFSAYSYAMEGRSPDTDTLAYCLFFILVDPALACSNASRPADHGSPWTRRGLLRCLIAASAWMAQGIGFACMMRYWAGAPLDPSRGASFLLHYGALFASYYMAHSATASLRIGLLTIGGMCVPEAYNYAFLASSPADFWRRWNLWTAAWIQRYLFFPLSVRIRRRVRGRASVGLAVIVTFIAIGFLHDSTRYAVAAFQGQSSWPAPKGTFLFFILGSTVVAWEWAAAIVRTRASQLLALARNMAPVANYVLVFHSHALAYGAASMFAFTWRSLLAS